jgi:hypothetical protein
MQCSGDAILLSIGGEKLLTDVMLRPDLKTAGGEVNDILWNGQFIGTMTLVYREADRMSGAVQLEEENLPRHAKQHAVSFLQSHIQSLIDALGVQSCDVLITYSNYDQIISTDSVNLSALKNVEEDHDYDFDQADTDRFGDEDLLDQNEYSMDSSSVSSKLDAWDKDDEDYGFYELVSVEESRNKIEYHIYDEEQELAAEASIRISGRNISGTVNWRQEPADDEIETVADLLVSDFEADEVDTFVLHMKRDQEIIETIELTHEDLFEDDDAAVLETKGEDWIDDDYTIVLVRDDSDALTYEIYRQSHGGLPIGTATVDISQRALTGFIDFREPGDSDDREEIAQTLMRELDKEKDFESFNVTMLFQNRPFEELLFETEQVH